MQLKTAKRKSSYSWSKQSANKTNLNLALKFIVFCLVQVLVLDELVLFNYFNPLFYFAFIIILPFRINHLLLLSLSFIMGLCVDAFHGTLGLNASACVTLAFAKIIIAKFMSPNSQFEKDFEPTISKLGFVPFLTYITILAFIFNLFYVFTELFSFAYFGATILKVLASTGVSVLLILVYHVFFGKR